MYAQGTLGREVFAIKRGVYKCDIKRIKNLLKKMTPDRRSGAWLFIFIAYKKDFVKTSNILDKLQTINKRQIVLEFGNWSIRYCLDIRN